MLYDIMLSSQKRDHVINYIRENKKTNPTYRVIDIGGSADYTNWSHDVVDYIVDINSFEHDRIKMFNININYESEWEKVLQFVEQNGKFDFCICSHTLEDIALPALCLRMMPLIAKEGFVATPSKYREFTRVGDQPWLGYIHHRWIFTIKDGVYIALPKLNFIEHVRDVIQLGNPSDDVSDLSFFWKDTLEYKVLNDDYMGPTVKHVLYYYGILLEDDI